MEDVYSKGGEYVTWAIISEASVANNGGILHQS